MPAFSRRRAPLRGWILPAGRNLLYKSTSRSASGRTIGCCTFYQLHYCFEHANSICPLLFVLNSDFSIIVMGAVLSVLRALVCRKHRILEHVQFQCVALKCITLFIAEYYYV